MHVLISGLIDEAKLCIVVNNDLEICIFILGWVVCELHGENEPGLTTGFNQYIRM